MQNSTRAWLFLSVLSLILIISGHFIGGREGLLWGFAIALCVNTISYFYSDFYFVNQYHGHLIEGQDSWGLISITQELSKKARIHCPEIYLFDCLTPQALATGRNWKSGQLFISTGAVEKLTLNELKAIVAYQIITLKNHDTLAFTIASSLAQGVMFLPQQADRLIALTLGPKWEFQKKGQVLAWAMAPLASLIVHLCINRQSILNVDKEAAKLCGSSQNLASALWKLTSYQKTRPQNFAAPSAHLFIVSPLTGKTWTGYFNLQPGIKERLKNLIGYYPL